MLKADRLEQDGVILAILHGEQGMCGTPDAPNIDNIAPSAL